MTKTELEAKLTALGTKIDSIEPYTVLRDDTNFDEIPTNRLFQVYINKAKVTECNAPADGCLLVYTCSNNATNWKDLTIQFAICHSNENLYVRQRSNGTYKAWKTITKANLNALTSDKTSIGDPGEM